MSVRRDVKAPPLCTALPHSHYIPASKGTCSALFLQKIIANAKEAAGEDSVVTLEHVREAASQHDFLEGVLDDVDEASAPKRPRKKKPKLDKNVKDSVVQDAIIASAAAASIRPEITVDEEEYD